MGKIIRFYLEAGDHTKHYLDEGPWEGDNYYRLAMLEIPSNDLEYSPVKSLHYSGLPIITLKSTIIMDQGIVLEVNTLSSPKLTGLIYNEQGLVVGSFSLTDVGSQTVELDQQLPPGSYWISIFQNGEPVCQERFLKL